MSVWSFMQQNSDVLWMVLFLLLNLPALCLHVVGLFRTGRASDARAWARILEEATRLKVEAECLAELGTAERLCYVLTRLQMLCTELGVAYDEERLIAHLTAGDGMAETAAPTAEEKRETDTPL